MSTIKSSAENLTLNADGSGNDVLVQSNGSTKAIVTAEGNVGIGTSSPAQKLDIQDSNYGVRISPVPSSNFVRIQLPTNEGSALDAEKYIIAYNGSHSGNPHTLALKSNNSAGNLGFFTNNSERMTIDSTGAVTMPAQPAFLVASSANQNNITVGDAITIVYGTEVFDQNSDFTSNTFTAPVSGKYQLSATTRIGSNIDSASSYYMLELATSNRQYKSIFDPDFGQDNVYWSVALNVLADMDAGDTVNVKVTQNNGDAITDIEGAVQYTYFSGYLVC